MKSKPIEEKFTSDVSPGLLVAMRQHVIEALGLSIKQFDSLYQTLSTSRILKK
jgi:hypothetical protein